MKSNNEIPQYCRDLRLYFKLHKITRYTKYANKYKVQNYSKENYCTQYSAAVPPCLIHLEQTMQHIMSKW